MGGGGGGVGDGCGCDGGGGVVVVGPPKKHLLKKDVVRKYVCPRYPKISSR